MWPLVEYAITWLQGVENSDNVDYHHVAMRAVEIRSRIASGELPPW